MFYDASRFPQIHHLERNWTVIRDEVAAAEREHPQAFKPWFNRDLYTGEWGILSLVHSFMNEKPVRSETNCRLFPKTMAVLDGVDGLHGAGFSRLMPHTRIRPHRGYRWKVRVLRVLLGLRIPPGCAINVMGQKKAWQEGKALVFDDTYPHEAWNRSAEPRLVLGLDIRKDGVPDEWLEPRDAAARLRSASLWTRFAAHEAYSIARHGYHAREKETARRREEGRKRREAGDLAQRQR